MSFTQQQVRKLKAGVRASHVKAREVDGKTLHYLEGWHVLCEANRIFGFDAWDRETVSSECVWRTQVEGQFAAAYLTRVRIRVRAGGAAIIREGLGSGEALAPSPGQAHERAAKAAETDATKRALSTFGNPFGLSLYRDKREAPSGAPQTLGASAQRVVKAVARAMRESDKDTLDERRAQRLLDGHRGERRRPHPFIREPHVAGDRNGRAEGVGDTDGAGGAGADNAVAGHADARSETASVAGPSTVTSSGDADPVPGFVAAHLPVRLPRVDKSVLTLAEPRRIRNPEHLKFVATQPCTICARTPSEAHHLRIAQPRALGRKVSDEFTVPLCALHHRDLHAKGDEREWWWGHSIEPLSVAARLWAHSRGGGV